MLKTCVATALALAGSLSSAAQPATAPAHTALTEQTTSRLVVKYRDPLIAKEAQILSTQSGHESVTAQRAQFELQRVKVMGSGAIVYHLGKEVSLADARAAAARIAEDPSIEYAEPDLRIKAQTTGLTPAPDPFRDYQWPLMPASSAPGGGDFASAWTKSTGTGAIVGVIDSGIVPHADLNGKVLHAYGYDFVSADAANQFGVAGDGDARDNDATDPGDFCLASSSPSTWHGLMVASVIVASKDNGYGIAGAAHGASVLPIRALGRCGGYLSDAADALTWAVGDSVPRVPINNNPVTVVNLSVGTAPGAACPIYFMSAVLASTRRNIPVVVAAGNEGANDVGAPANCAGVIVVGAHTRSADLASYSNRSAAVTLTAPGGGNCASQLNEVCLNDPIAAVSNAGMTAAGLDQEAVYFMGTSTATAHVTAAVALMRVAAPNLTLADIKALLIATAKPYAANSFCASLRGVCGAGMLDAAAAVSAVNLSVLSIMPSYSTPAVAGGQNVSLTVRENQGLASTYQWTQVSGTPVTLQGASTATLSFNAPAQGSNLVFRVTVTTSLGATVSLDKTVIVNDAPTLAVK